MARPEDQSPPRAEAERWLSDFQRSIAQGDIPAAAALFGQESYWRDLVAFSWNIVTVEGPAGVEDLLRHATAAGGQHSFELSGEPTASEGITEAWFVFETAVGRGHGLLRLKDGQAWTFLTALDELKGHEEPVGVRRPPGAQHGAVRDRVTWLESRERERSQLGNEEQPYVLIVGAGQGGLGLAARLRQLGVPTIVVDRHARPGDSWRTRYKSLCLHDPVHLNHMPYLPFPENWPVFMPKDKIADWLEAYATLMELNFWGSTTCVSARRDEDSGWEVVLDKEGEQITLRPQHLVLATGVSGKPQLPSFPGMDRFRGDQHHSSQHPGPDAYADKRVVVVGANNSAHDICQALWEVGADVTMVQRSSTTVVRSSTLLEVALDGLYSESALAAGMTTERADSILASFPYRIQHEIQKPNSDEIRRRDAEYYAALAAAGFQVDFGEDESGLAMKYARRGSGYYIDVGASELVANGSIRLARGAVRELTETAVVLEDGKELPADLVVYATGYGSMNGYVADLISQEVADKVGKVWGLGSGTYRDPGPWEGEERNLWKPTQQEALWFHGGNLQMSRFYSRPLALQLKARHAGLPTPVYALAEVHHAT